MDLDLSNVKVRMPAAAAVIVKEGDNGERLVLLIQRSSKDHWPRFWEFPRGKCDKGHPQLGENLIHCCKREIKEETGLDVIPMFKIDEFQYLADNGTRLTTCHNFLCKMKDPTQKVKLSHEHQRHKWVQSVGEAEMMLLPDQKKTLKKILNRESSISAQPENDFTDNKIVEESRKIRDSLKRALSEKEWTDPTERPELFKGDRFKKLMMFDKTEEDFNDARHSVQPTLFGLIKHYGGDYRGRETGVNSVRGNFGGIKFIKKYLPDDWQQKLDQYAKDQANVASEDSNQELDTYLRVIQEQDKPCWKGYEMVGFKMKNGKKVPNCVPIKESEEKENKPLNKPFRMPAGSNKKFGVYVKNDKGNVVKVTFGDPNMEIKRDDPERLKSFRARHNCASPGPRWKARYWSCKMWMKRVGVSDLLKGKK